MTTTRVRRPRITTTREAIAKVYETMEKYDQLGACDTEPRAEFALMLVRLAEGKAPEVPQNASDWQLYSSEKGSFFAAKALTRAAERVVKLAQASTAGMDGVVGFCNENRWI